MIAYSFPLSHQADNELQGGQGPDSSPPLSFTFYKSLIWNRPKESMMSNAPILFKTKRNIAQITLNRPDNRNSMDDETMPAFNEAVSRAKEDKDLRCLIITGSGNSFC